MVRPKPCRKSGYSFITEQFQVTSYYIGVIGMTKQQKENRLNCNEDVEVLIKVKIHIRNHKKLHKQISKMLDQAFKLARQCLFNARYRALLVNIIRVLEEHFRERENLELGDDDKTG